MFFFSQVDAWKAVWASCSCCLFQEDVGNPVVGILFMLPFPGRCWEPCGGHLVHVAFSRKMLGTLWWASCSCCLFHEDVGNPVVGILFMLPFPGRCWEPCGGHLVLAVFFSMKMSGALCEHLVHVAFSMKMLGTLWRASCLCCLFREDAGKTAWASCSCFLQEDVGSAISASCSCCFFQENVGNAVVGILFMLFIPGRWKSCMDIMFMFWVCLFFSPGKC